MTDALVDISGLDKASVLAVLFNRAKSRPFRLGCTAMHVTGARAILDRGKIKLSRLGWRRLDVDLSGDSFDPSGFDSHNGPNAAADIIASLRDAEKYVQEHPPTGTCPVIPKPSTRFLQLRLMFGDWYFVGKTTHIVKVKA